MIKKLIIILFILCLPFQASALGPMSYMTGGDSQCPPFYADTNVVWSWDGNYPGSHNTACDSAGTPDVADTDSATTGTDYGESGGVGLLIDGVSDYLRWNQTAQQYIDETSAQTICMRINISATVADYTWIFAAQNVGDEIEIFLKDTGVFVGVFNTTDDPDVSEEDAAPPTGSFVTVGYTFQDAGSNGDLSVNDGNGGGTWSDGWDDDIDGIDSVMTNALDDITIGHYSASNGPDAGKTVYIDKVAIINGYKFDCSSLTGSW